MGLIIGFVVGSVLLSVLMYVAIGRVRRSLATNLSVQNATITDLRQELADDKETNRRLRHELHSLSSGAAAQTSADVSDRESNGLESSAIGAIGVSTVNEETAQQLADAQRSLESARSRLADREAKLREYREALQEIRLSLEAQDRLRGIITITEDIPGDLQAEDVPANAQAD